MKYLVSPSNLNGTIKIPGNKSATLRAIVIGGLAEGISKVSNPLIGLDCLSVVNMMRILGAKIDTSQPGKWIFEGVANELQVPGAVLDTENCGTGLFTLTAVSSLIDGCSVISGDYQICNRPAQPLIDALNDLGAKVFSTRNSGTAPLVVQGPMKGGKTSLPGMNSQWLSPLLQAGALTPKGVTIRVKDLVEIPYVNMTMAWMKKAGVSCMHKDYEEFTIPGKQRYTAFNANIPAEWGTSGYPMIAAAITDSKVTFEDMDPDDFAGERMYPHILKEMGAKVTFREEGRIITVEGGNELHGIEIDCSDISDAVPTLAVLGCRASGKTVLNNIGGSRLKETDRTRSIKEELTKMGGRFDEKPDSLTIYQSDLKAAKINGRHDHRIVMATAVAALIAKGESEISTAEYSRISFPNFYELMVSIGAKIVSID